MYGYRSDFLGDGLKCSNGGVDFPYSISGFLIGGLVGFTGVGGDALVTGARRVI